jgi:hypothetical protein
MPLDVAFSAGLLRIVTACSLRKLLCCWQERNDEIVQDPDQDEVAGALMTFLGNRSTRPIVLVAFRDKDWTKLARHCELLVGDEQTTSSIKQAAEVLGAYARRRHRG